MHIKLGVAAALLVSTAAFAQPADLAKFDAQIKPDDQRDWMRQMASAPNQVGSPHDRENAEFQLKKFREWGWDARIETFEVLYPTPISETLELIGPTQFKATLTEPPVTGDDTSAITTGILPAYVAYQGDGDVQAGLVYVNYGMPDDYKQLARMGVSVSGKIVIARYGSGWRGLKPKLAQDHGAIGCIIYSDPSNDGYAVDKPYPDGPMRPPHGLQRGSVADMPIFPGDPLTPGIAATHDAKRLTRETAPTILKIPVLPISYADAEVFLAALGGPVVPPEWRGALPITYHVGPGSAEAHLAVKSDWGLKTIYDVIAVMKGSTYPDQWVLRGNHHDGWVFGATDPLSGQMALMSEAKAIGALAADGYRPKRTLVYASWDAEEPMLVGSTEWVEAHAEELKRKAVLYINSDTNTRGFLSAGGNQDFTHLVNQVAATIKDPQTGVTVGERLRAKLRVDAQGPDATSAQKAAGKLADQPGHDFPIEPLGSGSDFSPFAQHIGVPVLAVEYQGEGNFGGVYHSLYDSFTHHSRFVDPGFIYGALLARTNGRIVLAAADAPGPVQRITDLAEAVAADLAEVKKLAEDEREAANSQDRLLRDRAYVLAADPTLSNAPPERLDPVPFIEFAKLDNAVEQLTRVAKAYDAAAAAHMVNLPADRVERLSALMQTIDQLLAPSVGLPGRPWYKSLIYAPGRFTGYGAKTLPGVREAIEERRWADADKYAALTADALGAYTARLNDAVAVLDGK